MRSATTTATATVSIAKMGSPVESQHRNGVRMPAMPPGMIDPGDENRELTRSL